MAYHIAYPFNFVAKLPDLAMQNLTRQMDLQDLILLSSCSKRCALAIRISRVPAASINIGMRSNQFKIYTPDGSFRWQFEFGEFNTQQVFKIKDIPATIYRDGVLKTKLKNNLDEAFNIAISQIMYIIPNSDFSKIYLDLWNDSLVNFRCDIALAGVSQVKELCLYGREDPSESVKYLLENIHATDKIVDQFRHKDTDIIDKKLILTTPNLCFHSAEFLKPFNHFPNTSTETATFCDVQFDKKSLIDFLKWFLSAPASQIRNFKGIKWENRKTDFEIPDLSELGAKECDLKLRAQHFPCGDILCCAGNPIVMGSRECTSHFIDTEDGLDIMRSDGLLGTILEWDGCIVFVVWHERFPEPPPEEIRPLFFHHV